MAKKKPRPICPHCGSINVVIGDRLAHCQNQRCKKVSPKGSAFAYGQNPHGIRGSNMPKPRAPHDE